MREKIRWIGIVLVFVLQSGCHYHFSGEDSEQPVQTISVSRIPGDEMGKLNAAIVRALSRDPRFEFRQQSGTLTLEVNIVSDDDDRIGYRYDRSPSSGRRRKNIVGIENRRLSTVEVRVIHEPTEEVLLGPIRVKGRADYDYIDPNSIRDLTFTNAAGVTQTVMNFSLGQLDSVEGAHDDAGDPVYEQIAQVIVAGLAQLDIRGS